MFGTVPHTSTSPSTPWLLLLLLPLLAPLGFGQPLGGRRRLAGLGMDATGAQAAVPSTVVLVLLLVLLSWGPRGGVCVPPKPTGDYLRWLDRVGVGASKHQAPSLARNLKVHSAERMKAAGQRLRFNGHKWLDRGWQPWRKEWTLSLNKLKWLGGAFQPKGGPTRRRWKRRQRDEAGPLRPSRLVRWALDKVLLMLPDVVLKKARRQLGSLDARKVLALGWHWRTGSGTHANVCLPYVKAKVSRQSKIPRGDKRKARYISLAKGGYLRVLCGWDADGQVVQEYAHRLVCFAFNGKPRDYDHKVVSHTCHNPACLNPRHMRWTDVAGNLREDRGV